MAMLNSPIICEQALELPSMKFPNSVDNPQLPNCPDLQPFMKTHSLSAIASFRSVLAIAMTLYFGAFPLSQQCFASQAGKEFNDADAALNNAYKAALSTITEADQRALFVQAQRAWIKFRDDNVAFFEAHYPESKGGLFYKIRLTRDRTAFLKALRETPPDKDGEGPSGYEGE
jgi:uncharacterized protein YecT (DUF1311 family)